MIKNFIHQKFSFSENGISLAIFNILFYLSMTTSVLMGIIGSIIYHIGGNDNGNIIDNIKAYGFDEGIDRSFDLSSADFMKNDITAGFFFLLALIMIVISFIYGFQNDFGRTLAFSIFSFIEIGCFIFIIVSSTLGGSNSKIISTVYGLCCVYVLIGFPIIYFKMYKSTSGGYMLGMAVISLLMYFFGAPLITIGTQNILNSIVFVLICVAVFLVFIIIIHLDLSGISGSSSTSSYSSSSSSSNSTSNSSSRKNEKIQNRIDYLKKKNRDISHGINEHNKGTFGYGLVDEKYSISLINKNSKEIKSLEKERRK